MYRRLRGAGEYKLANNLFNMPGPSSCRRASLAVCLSLASRSPSNHDA